jgi:hypothetical protein
LLDASLQVLTIPPRSSFPMMVRVERLSIAIETFDCFNSMCCT